MAAERPDSRLAASASARLTVRRLTAQEALTPPVALAAAAGFPGLDSWTRIAQQVYGFDVHRLVAEQDGLPCGLLSMIHVRHPFFGAYLTSAPFASYGGFAFASDAARDALLQDARALAQELGVGYVNVRFEQGELPPPPGWIQQPLYATYRAELTADLPALLASYSSDHRNHIRKSLKQGFRIEFGRLELLDRAYEGLARSMHELGSPYHAKSYLRCMASSLGETLEFAVLSAGRGEVAGAGVFILQDRGVTNLHANILRALRPQYAGEFLYWSVISRYAQQGYRVFDMGRSLIGSGNETFKMKWRPQPRRLAYWYSLPRAGALPELNQKNAKFQLAIQTWKLLPAFVVRPIGPFLIKGLA